MASRSGSNAGRGFRYQDAVAAWLAASSWARSIDWGLVVPEGGDDVELRGEQLLAFVQVKSRRSHLGIFTAGDAAGFIRELWNRHDAAETHPTTLFLILERPVAGEAQENSSRPVNIALNSSLGKLLASDERAPHLLAKTQILVLDSPRELAINLLATQQNCSPLAAQICFAELFFRIGQLSDENGRKLPEQYLGLSRSDVDFSIRGILEAFDPTALEPGVIDGLCEPVDFVTPLAEPDFYLGVDVEPGHIAAGLVVERPSAREAIANGLYARGNVLIVGPSGTGKSAMMWEAAHSVRHAVHWYRVRRLNASDIPALRQLARLFRASRVSPIGFIFDDVGRHGFDGWSQLASETPAGSGILLLGSVREEDIFLLSERARSLEIRVEPDSDLAERLWNELRIKSATQWAGWREPWEQSGHLLLEYTYILSQGNRMSAVLADQVSSRLREPERSVELAILRISSCAGAAGALIYADRLTAALGLAEADVSRALQRLIEEHLVRATSPGLLGGLHQLRSETLLQLSHAIPPPAYSRTFALTALSVVTADLEGLIADALQRNRTDLQSIISGSIARLAETRDPKELAAVLRGLASGGIDSQVERWLAFPSVQALPRTQVTSAALFGITGVDLSALSVFPGVFAAAQDLNAIVQEVGGDPRHLLLSQLPENVLADLIQKTTDLQSIERILAALVGQPLPPQVRTAIDPAPEKRIAC